jgi:mannitol/fructose-specific phosphotransferase system IIA component (Ntr-type)
LTVNLINYLCKSAIFFDFPNPEKNEILRLMCEELSKGYSLPHPNAVLDSVYNREEDKSTGIGRGLAVPHCRSKLVDSIYISLSILEEGVYWDAIDKQPVKVVFLVVGPEEKPEEYLHVLSVISRLIRNDIAHANLLRCKTVDEVWNVINGQN